MAATRYRQPGKREETATAGGRKTAGKRKTQAHGERGAAPDRRDSILAAATRRFAEFGFEATTVRQIADDVKLLSGSLYHHFSTKEEILDQIVCEAVLSIRDQAIRIATLPLNAEQRLVALIMTDLTVMTDNQAVYAIAFNERKLFRRSAYFAHLVKAKKETYEAWRTILQDGMESGLFNPEIDIYLTISTIIRMLTTGADWFRNEDGSPLDALATYSLEALLDFYLGFILRAIRAPGRAGEPIPEPTLQGG